MGDRCRIPGRSASTIRSSDLVGLLDGRRALVFGHSYGGNVALATAARHPELVVAVAVYETPLSWLDWWPGTTAGADAIATRGDPADAAERFVRRLSATRDGRSSRRRLARRDGRRARRWSASSSICASTRPWTARRRRRRRSSRCTASAAPPITVRAPSTSVASWPTADIVEVAEARHFGPNTNPEAVAAAIVELASRAGDDGASRVADTGHDEAGGDRRRGG